jgi:hypothetical protein
MPPAIPIAPLTAGRPILVTALRAPLLALEPPLRDGLELCGAELPLPEL